MATETTRDATSCRQCAVRCDKVVYPSGCIATGCNRLYAYEEDGRRFVGCLERVFRVELDLDAFEQLEEARHGFGALRAAREPLPMCQTDIDSAFAHRAVAPCVNPAFFWSSGSGSVPAVPLDLD